MEHLAGIRRRGLTLIELLAASVLSLLLMGAVLGVLNSVTRHQTLLLNPSDKANHQTWESRLISQFYWDLSNSRRISTKSGCIILEGYAGRDFETHLSVHCPTTICYELISQGERKDLYRSEIHTGSRSLKNSVSELVCIGVDDISLKTSTASKPRVTSIGAPKSSATSNVPDGDIPERLSLSFSSNRKPTVTFQHVFTLR